jgi:hypothetical protein
MLDLAGILFSSCLMLFVIVRAVQLDRVMPWFQTITRKPGTGDTGKAAGSSGGTHQSAPWRRQT